jgi:hypothetical protein
LDPCTLVHPSFQYYLLSSPLILDSYCIMCVGAQVPTDIAFSHDTIYKLITVHDVLTTVALSSQISQGFNGHSMQLPIQEHVSSNDRKFKQFNSIHKFGVVGTTRMHLYI